MSAVQFSPVPEGTSWPSGEGIDLAFLSLTESDVAARLNLPLVRGTEDLRGRWAGLAGRLPSGDFVEFVCYLDNPPRSGVILRVDKGARYCTALDEALQLLGISRRDVLWLSRAMPLHCPKCGEILSAHDSGGLVCFRGRTVFTPELEQRLREVYAEQKRTPRDFLFTDEGRPTRIGGQWFCPGCGVAARENTPGDLRCPNCSRSLVEFVYSLIEGNPHFG